MKILKKKIDFEKMGFLKNFSQFDSAVWQAIDYLFKSLYKFGLFVRLGVCLFVTNKTQND